MRKKMVKKNLEVDTSGPRMNKTLERPLLCMVKTSHTSIKPDLNMNPSIGIIIGTESAHGRRSLMMRTPRPTLHQPRTNRVDDWTHVMPMPEPPRKRLRKRKQPPLDPPGSEVDGVPFRCPVPGCRADFERGVHLISHYRDTHAVLDPWITTHPDHRCPHCNKENDRDNDQVCDHLYAFG